MCLLALWSRVYDVSPVLWYESIMCLLFYGMSLLCVSCSMVTYLSDGMFPGSDTCLWCLFWLYCDVSTIWCPSWLHGDVSVMSLLTQWLRVYDVSPGFTVTCLWCDSWRCGHVSIMCLQALRGSVYDVSVVSVDTCLWYVSWFYGHESMMWLLALWSRVYDLSPDSGTCLWCVSWL